MHYPAHLCVLLSIVFLFLLTMPAFGQGQRFLALDKPGKVKRLRYYVGDEIKIKLKGDKLVYTDQIEEITDTSLVIRKTHIPIRNIRAVVRFKQGGLLNQAISKLPIAGAFYFLADTFNPVFYGGEVEVSRSGIIVGSSLIASSFALRLVRKRTYRINQYRTLKVLQTF